MNLNWSLDAFYPGLDSPAFRADFDRLDEVIAGMGAAVEQAKTQSPAEGLTGVLTELESAYSLFLPMLVYTSLLQSVDATDSKIASVSAQLSRKLASTTPHEVAIQKYIASLPDLETLLDSTPFLRSYRFFCLKKKREAEHMLSDETEAVVSQLNLSGAEAWSNLFGFLTSTVKVDYEGESITLSEVRNLAYDADPAVRRAAYEAELASYDKVKDSIAFSLNSIKGQAATLCRLRGYPSVLDMTLEQSHMKRETLEAMFSAMNKRFPAFRRYLKAKAKLLGHEGSLPWYDLFAPVGKTDYTFTVEQTRDYLVEVFNGFAPDSGALIRQAFDEQWIDFMPKPGKSGGAFCSFVPNGKASRILTNFSGDFGSVDTLAHELGHAYHNRQIEDHPLLTQDYPMPIAETASTFNETHLCCYALERAQSREEKLAILELLLSGTTQTICDIYSRFLFEDAVFSRCTSEFLMADQLCQIMLDAQKQAYGDGLDADVLHPYMWACKMHYYNGEQGYYNFPYAFGCLMAMGLYSLYQQEGEAFLPKYRTLLHNTPVLTLEDTAASVGIDVTSEEFWLSSLDAFERLIDQYVALAEG